MPASVKICGLTRPEDAERAAAAGASFLGVVFAGGPRRVRFARAADVVAASRGVPVLGVFGSQSVEEILSCARDVRLSGAQLHGSYSRADAARLRSAGLIVWRVVRIASPADLDRLSEASQDADAVLVEPRVARAEGGSGVPLDLAVAVALVRPDVADVSSGVESLPGIKDHERIARFLEAVLGRSPTVG